MRYSLFLLILIFLLPVFNSYGDEDGPYEKDIMEYWNNDDVGPLWYMEEACGLITSPCGWSVEEERQSGWSISGGGSYGNQLAQIHFGLNIGYSNTETFSWSMSGSLPPQYSGLCCIYVPESWCTITHIVQAWGSKNLDDQKWKRVRYWIHTGIPIQYEGLITKYDIIGWARRNPVPGKLGMQKESIVCDGYPCTPTTYPRTYPYIGYWHRTYKQPQVGMYYLDLGELESQEIQARDYAG